MTASKHPRRDERRRAREEKRCRLHFFGITDALEVVVITQWETCSTSIREKS